MGGEACEPLLAIHPDEIFRIIILLAHDDCEELVEKLMGGLNRADLDSRLQVWTEVSKLFCTPEYLLTVDSAYLSTTQT